MSFELHYDSLFTFIFFKETPTTKASTDMEEICGRSKGYNLEGCVTESKHSLDDQAKENLLIKTITIEDAGSYKCCVIDKGEGYLSPRLKSSSAIPKPPKLNVATCDQNNDKTGELAVVGM